MFRLLAGVFSGKKPAPKADNQPPRDDLADLQCTELSRKAAQETRRTMSEVMEIAQDAHCDISRLKFDSAHVANSMNKLRDDKNDVLDIMSQMRNDTDRVASELGDTMSDIVEDFNRKFNDIAADIDDAKTDIDRAKQTTGAILADLEKAQAHSSATAKEVSNILGEAKALKAELKQAQLMNQPQGYQSFNPNHYKMFDSGPKTPGRTFSTMIRGNQAIFRKILLRR